MRTLGRALLIATFVMNAMGGFALAAQAPTSTTITSSKAPALTTDVITFTATITSNGQPVTEGQVQFKIDGSNAGFAIPVNESGKASINKFGSSVGVGDHNIAADYLGTPNFSPSTASLVQHVDPAGPNITIAPTTLPIGQVGQPYSITLTASGGVAPYSFSMSATNPGIFPAGLTLASTGLISGTPTAQGNYNFNVVAKDANGASSGDTLRNIKIDPAPAPTATPAPTPAPQPAPAAPPFSRGPRVSAPDGASTCTPRIMDMSSFSLPSTQSWYLRASGSSLNVGLYAVSVNVAEESGSVTGTLYDGASSLASATATFPPTFNGDESPPASLSAATVVGRVYRLEISAGAATTTPREARHYRLKIAGADQSGFNTPGLYDLEGSSKDAARWGLNVNGGESLDVTVLQGNIEPALTADLTLLDPSGAVARTAPGVGLPHSISVAAAAAGQWTLLVKANEHYGIDKTSGSDRGVYAMWDTGGTGALTVNLTSSSGPVQPADVSVTLVGGTATLYSSVTALNLTGLAAGEYDVSVTSRGSYTVSPASQRVKVTCDGSISVTFAETAQQVPTISISDVSVNEPDSGMSSAAFTVTLSTSSAQTITVGFTTADGTAKAGLDYIGNSIGSLTFAPGETTKTIGIAVIGELLREATETFFVNLAGPTNATIADAQGVGTIIDNDPEPAISIGSATVTEGNTGVTSAVFTVSLTNPSGSTVTVQYATVNDTATAGTDYVALTSTTLTFAPGETTKTIGVTVNGDTALEGDETFFVNLSGPSNATIATARGVGTILNDDADTTTTTYTGPLTGVAGEPIQLTATVKSSSGRVVNAGSVTFTVGQSSSTAPVQNGSAATSLIVTSPGVQIGTVAYKADDGFSPSRSDFQITIDGQPVASIADARTYEGDTGVTVHVLTVTLSRASSQQIQLSTTNSGTALSYSDFDMQPAIVFIPYETSKAFEIRVYGDTIYEADETVEVRLSVISGNVAISTTNGIGTLTILNDDAPPQVSIVDKPVALYEGDTGTTAFEFAVTLSAASAVLVAVDYSTADGTATSADTDYRPLSGTVTFLPGETFKTITVQAVGDLRYETDEDFTVTLSRPHNATLGASIGTGQILNDDKVPSLSVATKPVALYEGNSGTTAFDFTVTLSAASSLDTTVVYAAVGGTARAADGDFTATGGRLTFLAGETLKTITVPVIGDLVYEADEDFTVVIAFPTNATITSDTGYGTILNDDAAPVVRVQARHHSVTEGNSGITPVDITLELSAAIGLDVTVTWSTRDGTAVALADYSGLSGTATVAAGATTATLTVNVLGELVYEADQQFAVDLRFATNATIDATNDVAAVTIVNDDGVPEVAVSETRADEGNSGPTPLVFTVTLTNASDEPVEVDYQTSDVTATVADGDYRAAVGTFTFTPGTTAGSITVIVNGDLTFESPEKLQLTLTGARGATIASPRDTVGFILNDDAIPTVRTTGTSFGEGTGGTRSDVQTVTLSNPSDQDIYVRITLRDGTAVRGLDFGDPVDSVLIFRAGDVSESTLIPWVTDSLDEDDETYGIELTVVSGLATVGGSAISRIVDDDDPPTLAIRNATQAEGDSGTIMLPFDITLSEPSGRTVTVDFRTTAGTATSGFDYQALTYTVTFPPGATRVEANIRVYGDTTGEADETLTFSVTGLTNATLGAIGTITLENDDLPSVRLILPADGAVYVVGQHRLADGTLLAADYVCTNALSCSGTSAVGTAIDTSSVGTRTFTATAVDAYGNLATVTHTYRVAYAFGGFLDPVEPGRTYRLGSTVPIKFRLSDANGELLSSATARIFAFRVHDSVPDTQPTETDLIPDDQDTFRWADDHYQYNLGTKLVSEPGLYVIFVDLDDGSTYKTTVYLKR